MRRFLLFLNRGKGHAAEKAASIRGQLLSPGAELVGIEKHGITGVCDEDYDYVLTLGGDETLTRVTRGLTGSGVPLIGINLGHLGYLTVTSNDEETPGALEKPIADDYVIEEWTILNDRVIRNGHESLRDHEWFALDEIIVS